MDVVEETDGLVSTSSVAEFSNVNDTELEVPTKRMLRLPLARVKNMMKLSPDCLMISQDSLFLVTKVTEMFIEFLAVEAVKNIGTGKRKTLLKRDVETAIENIPSLCFLDGALE